MKGPVKDCTAQVVYNHWTGTVDWNGGITTSAKMESKGSSVVDAWTRLRGSILKKKGLEVV